MLSDAVSGFAREENARDGDGAQADVGLGEPESESLSDDQEYVREGVDLSLAKS